jgi:ATP-dependent DNA helicase RecQ
VVAAPAHGDEMEANRMLGRRVAEVGNLPFLDCFEWRGSPAPTDSSSGPLVAHLETSIRLDGRVRLPDGPVLLCAVTARTRWTITVAGALLREAGATAVLPLVLHQRP